MNDFALFSKHFFTFERVVRGGTSAVGAGGHYHSHFEVYYLLEGSCWYFIKDTSYHLTAGDIAFIPEGALHRTSYEGKAHKRLLIFCDDSFLPDSVRSTLSTIGYFARSEQHAAHIDALFAEIEREYTDADEFSEDVIRARLAELFVLVARACREAPTKKEESPFVEQAVRYIREHYTEEIGLSDVAASCYVSKEHLSRTFRRVTGFGFCEFLTAYRLKKAEAMLLSSPERKVAEVALACGFNDSNYFSKVYKSVYGKSPTQHRKGT